MNCDSGEVKRMAELTAAERASGDWARISDDLASAAQTARLADQVKELRRKARQLEGLRKPGRR